MRWPPTRFWFLSAVAIVTIVFPVAGPAVAAPKPNFVVIFADDLGYGDLGCYGHPTIATPHLDRMAAEGQRWTSFYSAAPVCTPSRAALLTGRLPIRSGMCDDRRRVLFPDSAGGLPQREITMAEALKQVGYATACIGKWHLGHLPQYLPTSQGFDSYFGIPYSNDMDRVADSPGGREAFWKPKTEYWNVPLMRNQEIVERPADQTTITRRYTDEAIAFIQASRDGPFYCYLAHNLPHVPLFASTEFLGASARGLYGDVVQEIDAGVGRILQTLRDLKLDRRTLVVFTSDNGPWLVFNQHGGSAGLLRDGKGSTWEGGMREPALFWWPGIVKPGVVREMGSTMDVFATCIALAGAKLPDDRVIDGLDVSPVLLGTGKSPRQTMFFYRGTRLYAVRHGQYKAHFITRSAYGSDKAQEHDPPLLFHLGHDPSERFNVASEHPQVVAEIRTIAGDHQKAMVPGEPQLQKKL
ncbi:MAG: sulfatase [Pirellulales bacterium]|nr:sulfatase [Pirellulales bacterium]